MKNLILIVVCFLAINTSFAQTPGKVAVNKSQYNKLTAAEREVIENKGTEAPNKGTYTHNKAAGTYYCKRCNAPLFRSESKFESGTGWPSFDDAIKGSVKRVSDADGMRTEIECANCKAHLGHVFFGEAFTPKSIRNCVNSISLTFVPDKK
ncbi:MAG: methionine-R-sulfoxide reductase [Sphingobacteriales bacterium]|nr:methionine-R-sulfoxide reductase [Sphingobacteriales bacterium]